jgi:pimeloyl-ACP methyl ester carboxylesterase
VLAGMVGDSYGVDDSHPPIVLLHGQTFSRKHWTPVIAELHRVDPGRRVIALDLPGHGESPAQLPHSSGHILSLLHTAVDQAGLAAPVMVGHSSSGGTVIMYAAVHPTSGAVDVDAIPTELTPLVRRLQSFEPQIADERISQVWDAMVASFHLELLDPEVRDFILADMDMRPDTLRSYWAEYVYGDAAKLAPMLRAVSADLAAKQVPVLMIAGAEPGPGMDFLIGPAMSQTTIEVWPNSGHFPHLAHAARFAERLAATATWRPARAA